MTINDIQWFYIINLSRREDRLRAFREAWKTVGADFPFEVFTACDGNDFEPPAGWDVGRGAYGCYLSHLSLLTQAVRFGDKHFVIFEDDARPVENFRELFEATLADLPDDFDQLYLGWQALNTRRCPPTKITERLGRAGNVNRNHATLWSRTGAIRFLARLTNLAERKPQHHIDHWMGELHEELTDAGDHAYNSYIAIPQLCSQAESLSDICGKTKPENLWYYRGAWAREYKPLVNVTLFTLSFGDVGRRGWLGYEKRRCDRSDSETQTVVSVHAPSTIWLENTEELAVAGYMNSTGHAREPVRVKVDGQELTAIQNPKDKTQEVPLPPGKHCLEFIIQKHENAFAHTYWTFSRSKSIDD